MLLSVRGGHISPYPSINLPHCNGSPWTCISSAIRSCLMRERGQGGLQKGQLDPIYTIATGSTSSNSLPALFLPLLSPYLLQWAWWGLIVAGERCHLLQQCSQNGQRWSAVYSTGSHFMTAKDSSTVLTPCPWQPNLELYWIVEKTGLGWPKWQTDLWRENYHKPLQALDEKTESHEVKYFYKAHMRWSGLDTDKKCF